MIQRKDILQVRYPHQTRARSIDAVALVMALLWVCVTFMLALNAGISLVMALERAAAGAILVYALVFVGLHIMARSAGNQNVKEDSMTEEASEAVSPEETVQEDTPGEAQERG